MSEWKPVPGYEELYEVSNCGQFRSIRTGKIKALANFKGYRRVTLCKNGVCKNLQAHRLVAMAFVDGYQDGLHTNHIDGIKSNNHFSNLEWVTRAENMAHSIAMGFHEQPRPVVASPIKGIVGFYFPSISSAAPHGFDRAAISSALIGRLRTHRGYTWHHAQEKHS